MKDDPRTRLIVESFALLTGKPLVDPTVDDLAHALWAAPRAVVAHGVEDDPIFFYGNAMALSLFGMEQEEFARLPSRFSAEPDGRDERARLLERVTCDGYIDDYNGVRISKTGRRFRIEQAIVWNLVDGSGVRQGQAATFDRWTPLD